MRFDSIKHRLPTREQIEKNSCLRILKHQWRDKNLWHFNRRSVPRATAIGLFCAFLPMPFEMLPAAIGAIAFSANLPLALAWVWISNPLTWIPLYTPAYLLGARLLGVQAMPLEDITLGMLGTQLAALWLGCLIVGAVAAVTGYWVMRILWRIKVVSSWRDRRHRHRLKKALKKAKSQVVSAAKKHRAASTHQQIPASHQSGASHVASSSPAQRHE